MTVSTKGSSSATMPSRTGSSVRAAEWAMAAEPVPASLLKAARRKPWISTPTKPPTPASQEKALGHDRREAVAQRAGVGQQDPEPAEHVEAAHERHDGRGDLADALDAADDDEAHEEGEHQAEERWRRGCCRGQGSTEATCA